MRVEKFEVQKPQKVSEFISERCKALSYNSIRKLLRQKDVKVNDKRIKDDVVLSVGDYVLVYLPDFETFNLKVVFEDENVIIVFKPRKIETVSEQGETDLIKVVSDYLSSECYAVHRLDRNTEGLVVFAKNTEAKKSLDIAIKKRKIEKYYLALVNGVLSKDSDDMIAYLKKDSAKAIVDIVDEPKNGYEKIETKYKLLKVDNDVSLVEVELVTGKTHQIRAHFAHIGHFVIGDEKYGDSRINKIYKSRYQNLCAYKLVFHFESGDFLSYLDGKVIELDKSEIKFCQNL